MNEKDLELKLLAGLPIPIEGVGLIYIPTLKEVISMGESRYHECLSGLLFSKNNIEGLQEQEGSNLEWLLAYTVHDKRFGESVFDGFKLIFKEEAHLGQYNKNVFFYLGDIHEGRIIDSVKFEQIQHVLKKANFIKDEPEYKPANDLAKKMIEMIKKNAKGRPKPKETMNLHSIINGLAWKSPSINLLNIFDLTVYQLYQGFYTTDNIDNYHHTLTGIYAGTVDGKNIKLSDLHWAKILNLN
jgi:hypothetical protein